MKTKNTFKKIGFSTCAVVAAATLTGGIIAFASNSTTANTASALNYIGEEEAKAIAFEHADVREDDSSFVSCRLDYERHGAEYDIEFFSDNREYDYEIDAQTGDILSYDHDMQRANATATPTDNESYINEDEALEIALQHAGLTEDEATFIQIEFDIDDGLAEYEVEWHIGRTEYNYTISAVDGEIWEYERELDD